MEKYLWESTRDIQDVLKDLIQLTDNPGVIDRVLFDYIRFDYKHLGAEGYRFCLWFRYAWSRASYHPAPVKGMIRATARGCSIEAQEQRWEAIVDSTMQAAFLVLCCLAAIAAPIAEFRGSIAVGMMFGVIATAIGIRVMYTRKRWKSRNALLDLLDRLANVERQRRY